MKRGPPSTTGEFVLATELFWMVELPPPLVLKVRGEEGVRLAVPLGVREARVLPEKLFLQYCPY